MASSCSVRPDERSVKGARYCCAINCSNNSLKSIDPRTLRPVKFHKFPDPIKDKDRCSKWIVNLRRADLSLKNVKSKSVCSVHFEPTMYCSPTDISSSRLLPTAVPTIVTCPNPPPTQTPSRPPPKKRKTSPVPSPLCSTNSHETDALSDASTSKDGTFEDQTQDKVKDLEEKLAKAQTALQQYRKNNKKLNRQVKRLKSVGAKQSVQLHSLHSKLDKARHKNLSMFLDQLPPVPSALVSVLLQKAKTVNWHKQTKVMELCLSLYFRSSSAYAVMRSSGFTLPHSNTLRNRFSNVLSAGVGLCPSLLEMVRLRTLALKDHEKHITLSLDGMTLKPILKFKRESDTIIGYEDYDITYTPSKSVADQGVVLMIRGLTLKWKQIIGFYLSKHGIDVTTLKRIVFNAIDILTNLGLTVDVLVMDQETSQWKFVKVMGVSTETPYFFVNDKIKCHVVPDPPHLIKKLRNNFMSKDIVFVKDGIQKRARFKFVQDMFKIDREHVVSTVPRLKEEHFTLPRGKKMKVILACQIFSHSVASAIKLFVGKKLLPEIASETAEFIEIVNSMWDFVDSHSLDAPPGKKAVTAKGFTEDLELFNFYFSFVSSFRFLREGGKDCKLPCHSGWLLALKSLKSLCIDLIQEQKLFTYLCLRKCNQDHVENLHSQIRGYNGFNDHPTAESYINALRCLACSSSTTELLDRAISAGANCLPDGESDSASSLSFHVQSSQFVHVSSTNSKTEEDKGDFSEINVPLPESIDLKTIETEVVNYIAGSVIHKLKKHRKRFNICEDCIQLAINKQPNADSMSLTSLKEYKPGALITVSRAVTVLCCKFEQCFQTAISNGLPYPHPRKQILQTFNDSFDLQSLQLNCDKNHMSNLLHAILSSYCNIRIFHAVKMFNQSLSHGKKGAELNKNKKLNM